MKEITFKALLCVIICFLSLFVSCSDTNVLQEFLKDTFPPTILSISPEDGSIGVLTDTDIKVFFSEPMDTTSVETAFSLTSLTPGDITGTFSWSGETNMTFNPAADLREAATYSVTISIEAKDRGNIPIENVFTSAFSTCTFSKIQCGSAHTLYLKEDSTVWCWGSNDYYQLAQVDNLNSNPDATQISGLSGIIAIGSGLTNSFAIQGNGTLIAWGSNNSGILGIGSSPDTYTPTTVTFPASCEIVSVASGVSHSLALDSDGNIWVWGSNSSGQLGDPALGPGPILTPVRLDNANLNNMVIWIAVGNSHSLAIVDSQNNDGIGDKLYAWGNNYYGQVGNPATYQSNQTVPFEISFFTAIDRVGAGASFSIALKTDGTVWTWGLNDYGQLGLGNLDIQLTPQHVSSITDRIIDIAAGATHTLALKEDGTMLSWGNNMRCRLGLAIPEGSQAGYYNSPQDVAVMTNVVSISAGTEHSIALKDDDSVWAWGDNEDDQLGDATLETYYTTTPQQVPGLD